MIINEIAKAAADLAFSVEYVDNETYMFRLNACRTCDFFVKERCKKCGCFMEVKAATRIHKNPKRKMKQEVTHCPIGRWGDLEYADFFSAISKT
jgi:hypothetical protein